MNDFTRITCPGCTRTLNVPAEAIGKYVSCPDCRAYFNIPRNEDGSAGTPAPVPSGRKVLAVPKELFGPALAVLFFGIAGTLVNGYLSLMFTFKPGSDLDVAQMRVAQLRFSGNLAESKRNASVPEEERPKLPPADAPLAPEEEALAMAWAPSMRPVHIFGTVMSVLTLIGGICLITGRYYWLAVLGCVAAAVNVDPFCCIPGGIAGIWGLLMLVRDDARRHFGRRPR